MSATTNHKFETGDLVWAKMKGFPHWPARLVDPLTTNLRKPPGNYKNKPTHCVFFFGSNNFAWIPEDAIKPYAEFKDQYIKLGKTNGFKGALAKIEEFILNGGTDDMDIAAADQNAGGGDAPTDGENADSLPSIDDELAAISADEEPAPKETPKEKKGKKEDKSSSGQKDYSRKPFSKPKRAAATSNGNDTEVVVAKKAKTEETKAEKEGSKSPTKTGGARNLLNRTSQYLLDSNSTGKEETDLDVSNVSAKSKAIRASSLKFGFIGLGLMGQRLLKNLLNSGHKVTIWNRTPSKCKEFVKAGAEKVTTPADVVANSDITFSCVADPYAVKELVFGNCGVLAEITSGKGYVEMTSIDAVTSNDISEAIIARGGRYLEAPVISSGKQQSEEGNLTILVAGEKSLFDDCASCFEAISKNAYYLGGSVGDASKMSLVVSMLMGNLIGALAESMALADRTGLSQKDLLEILSLSPLNCQTLISKGKAMIDGGFATEQPLTHMQKDLRLALQLGETYEHPLPITASTNEVFKHAKHLGYSEHDVAAVYIRSRF
ncbi:putative oxidoreductase GLYR1 -like protein [Halotydeus destructor]|nr:putative oxidoreductase GLYR1 -like protein [Halotydeus destructor]